MAKIIQLGPGVEPPTNQRWVLVRVIANGRGGISHNGLNTTFETPLASLNATLTEASRHADQHSIPAVYVRLP